MTPKEIRLQNLTWSRAMVSWASLKEYSGRHLQKSISTFLNLESGIHHIDLYLRLWDEAQEVLAPLSFLHLLLLVMVILELGSRIDNITQDTRKQPRKLKCSRYKWTHRVFHTPYLPRHNRTLTFKWTWMSRNGNLIFIWWEIFKFRSTL